MEKRAASPDVHRAVVDHIPLLWCKPETDARDELVIWLPGLGGNKDGLAGHLQEFARYGFTAISFDPVDHGERRLETNEEFHAKMSRNKRRYFWPIMTLTAEEFPRVIDWAIEHLGVSGRVMAGGISMGGDVAVTAAGLDRRIAAVAAGISTPDWLRPGTNEGGSEPDTYAWNCYRRSNPLTNLERYGHCPAITFQNGANDDHVPPDGARRFKQALAETYAACPDKLDITEHPVGHEYPDEMLRESVRWFVKHSAR